MDVKAGLYRHFQGQVYEVLGVAIEKYGSDKKVIYRLPIGKNKNGGYDPVLWMCTLKKFNHDVIYMGEKCKRFTKVDNV